SEKRLIGSAASNTLTSNTVRFWPSFSYSRCFSWPLTKIFCPLANLVTMFSARPSRATQDSQVVPASSHSPVSRFFLRAPQPIRKFATEFPSGKNLSSGSAARLPVAVISGKDICKSPKIVVGLFKAEKKTIPHTYSISRIKSFYGAYSPLNQAAEAHPSSAQYAQDDTSPSTHTNPSSEPDPTRYAQ